MKSKRSLEGELYLDHRFTPGLTDVETTGLPPGAGQGLFEAPTYTCSHCQTVVIINPDRQRDRAWCSKCDHYICDPCGAILAKTMQCRTLKQVFDELNDKVNHGKEIDFS